MASIETWPDQNLQSVSDYQIFSREFIYLGYQEKDDLMRTDNFLSKANGKTQTEIQFGSMVLGMKFSSFPLCNSCYIVL